MSTMTAKYSGQCRSCGGRIRVGDRIDYTKASGARHAACSAGKPTAAAANVELAPYRLGGGSGYGCEGWQPGQVVLSHMVADQIVRRTAPGASEVWLTVVRASRRYVREDGLSFGVGDDQGYIYSAECRLATKVEAAPAAQARAIRLARESARVELRDAEVMAERIGDRPDGPIDEPVGELVAVDRRCAITGGGSRWIITDDAVWFVRQNSADGDNWSWNNLRSGAIGYRLDRDEATVGRLREIATLAAGGAS